jgi:hypothetical protein
MSVLNTERGGRPKGLLLFFFSRSKGKEMSKQRKREMNSEQKKMDSEYILSD